MKYEQRAIKSVNTEIKCQIRSGVYHSLYISYGKNKSCQGPMYNQVSIITCIYLCSIYNVNVGFQFCYQLCQRTPIVISNRRIPYYAYYIYQSGSYETNQLETLSILSVGHVHTRDHGPDAGAEPDPTAK